MFTAQEEVNDLTEVIEKLNDVVEYKKVNIRVISLAFEENIRMTVCIFLLLSDMWKILQKLILPDQSLFITT